MIDGNRGDGEMGHLKRLAGFERHVFHYLAVVVSQLVKLRINRIVKNILLQQPDDFAGGVDADGLSQLAKKIIHKDGQAGDVVHVRVRDDYVTYLSPLRLACGQSEAAGVDGHTVIDQKAGQALRQTYAPIGIERTG